MIIEIMSRLKAIEFSNISHEEKFAVISISDPDKEGPNLLNNINNGIIYRHQEYFFDVDINQPGCITDEQAKNIAIFANEISRKVPNLIVHCEAGMSRSAGVAAAIMKYINGNDWDVFDNPKYRPNMTCYRSVLNALYEADG